MDEPEHIKKALFIQQEIYRKMDPVKKLTIAFELYEGARQLKAAALRVEHPDWTDDQVKKKVKEIFFHANSG